MNRPYIVVKPASAAYRRLDRSARMHLRRARKLARLHHVGVSTLVFPRVRLSALCARYRGASYECPPMYVRRVLKQTRMVFNNLKASKAHGWDAFVAGM